MTTCERVREILISEGGFRGLPMPLSIGSLTFDFSNALIGGERSNDLVIVVELSSGTNDAEVVRKVFALTRALDVLRSRRSVTVVLTLGQALPEMVRSLGRVCRVLAVGAPKGPNADQELHDWLSVLLPLTLPVLVEDDGEMDKALRKGISSASDADFVHDLLRLSNDGERAVKDRLRRELQTAVSEPLEEEQGND